MKPKLFASILTLVLFFQCNSYDSTKKNLSKLLRTEILEYEKETKLTFDESVVYFNKEVPTQQEFDLVKIGDYCYDYFIDKSGVIKLVEIRTSTYQDNITEILRKNVGYDPFVGIPLMDIDCDNLEGIIDDMYRLQPDDIRKLVKLDSMQLDSMNHFDYTRIIIVSIDKHCGLSSIVNKGKRSPYIFWNFVHHNIGDGVIPYYYNYFEDVVEGGNLHPELLALMTDRLLTNNGYKQAYGTQVVNGQVPIVRNKDSVDIRRASIGLGPLNEYLDEYYGLKWPAPKKNVYIAN